MKSFAKLLKIFTLMSGQKRITALVMFGASFIIQTYPELAEPLKFLLTEENIVNYLQIGGSIIGIVGTLHAQMKDGKSRFAQVIRNTYDSIQDSSQEAK